MEDIKDRIEEDEVEDDDDEEEEDSDEEMEEDEAEDEEEEEEEQVRKLPMLLRNLRNVRPYRLRKLTLRTFNRGAHVESASITHLKRPSRRLV